METADKQYSLLEWMFHSRQAFVIGILRSTDTMCGGYSMHGKVVELIYSRELVR